MRIKVVNLNAQNVHNLGGRIRGDAVRVQAKEDLNNIGGSITAGSELIAAAGRDLNIVSTTRSAQSTAGANHFSRTTMDRVAGLYVTGGHGVLVASAGREHRKYRPPAHIGRAQEAIKSVAFESCSLQWPGSDYMLSALSSDPTTFLPYPMPMLASSRTAPPIDRARGD